jgi:hypothetical protein
VDEPYVKLTHEVGFVARLNRSTLTDLPRLIEKLEDLGCDDFRLTTINTSNGIDAVLWMSPYSRHWSCALSGSMRGRIHQLNLTTGIYSLAQCVGPKRAG